jgi:hypothetical protein
MGRISKPIKKFKSKADQLMSASFKDAAFEYVKLAKDLDQNYEKIIFDDWRKENTSIAI